MTTKFLKSLSEPPPIPTGAIARVQQLLSTGRLFRYGEEQAEKSDVSLLENEFAQWIGRRYCVAMNSCGSTMFVALKSTSVASGTPVLFNAFTLAPVPGAIVHAGGVPIPVDVDRDLVIDLQHLAQQARASGSRHLLLSHMRGHIADLGQVAKVCEDLGITLIEDCAHTMGAAWSGRPTGTYGIAGCFSTQAFKHINSGEGGLFVTDDEDVAAKAILFSGSYRLYGQHGARPELGVFQKHLGKIPNCSLRMGNLTAALIRAQLTEMQERIAVWRSLYGRLAELLAQLPEISLPKRRPEEEHVPSSLQFSIPAASPEWMHRFVEDCRAHGVHLKWFGSPRAEGFTERLEHWQFAPLNASLPRTAALLATLCDLRIPLSLTDEDCEDIAEVIGAAARRAGALQFQDPQVPRPIAAKERETSLPLWTADEVIGATGGKWHNPPPDSWCPIRVSYDITALDPGNFVICMHPASWGANRPDTAQELPRIVASGATGAVIQPEQLECARQCGADFPLLLVPSTRIALRDLCRAARNRFLGKVIAVTGTVGKTTSREMLRFILDAQGRAVATRGNNNNVAGVERSMAYTPRDVQYSILEMGFGQPLDGIAVSSRQVRPHVALITALGLAHLDVFGDQVRSPGEMLELVAKQKLGVLAGMEPGATLVARYDPEIETWIKEACERRSVNLVTFGESDECNARLLEFRRGSDVAHVKAEIDGERVEYDLALTSRHMAINSVGVLATIGAVHGDLQAALLRLSTFAPLSGRTEIVQIRAGSGKAVLIDDSFNATPDSVVATLRILADYQADLDGRKIAVLGDILHLGPLSSKLHAQLADQICREPIDRVFTIGSEMLHLHQALPDRVRGPHATSLEELEGLLREYLAPGDVLTVKASTPVGLGQLVAALKSYPL